MRQVTGVCLLSIATLAISSLSPAATALAARERTASSAQSATALAARLSTASLVRPATLIAGGERRRTASGGYVTLPVRLTPGFTIARNSRSLHATITQAGCGPRYERARLRWSAHRLTVTLLARPDDATHVACPAYIAIVNVTVPLHRALGERAIYDGSDNPPRLVARAPGT